MSFISNKSFGFKILGPFYVMAQMLGLLLIKEIDHNVLSTKKGEFSTSYNKFKF